jgi:ribose transport system substrate-binding protein
MNSKIDRREFARGLITFSVTSLIAGQSLAQGNALTIGVALASDTNPFYITMKKGIEARAKELSITVVFVTANEVVAQQVNGINDLVARQVDGILVSPIDGVAVGSAYEAAGKAGIPVISIARHANSPYQSAFVTMDEKAVGRDTATWLGKRIMGTGEIAMISGPPGAATFRAIDAGLDEGFKGYPGLQVVFRKEAALTRETGLKQAEDVLVAHPDIKAIYCANDEIALGAVQAVAAASKQGQVVVTGMNGIPPAIRAVKDGSLGMTVELNAMAWGRLGLDTMVEWLRGNKPKGDVAIQHVLIDANNVDAVLARTH